jgi:hypothetical protein
MRDVTTPPRVSNPAEIFGAVDRFDPPRVLSGWVKARNGYYDPSRVVITVSVDGRVIGKGHVTQFRADIIDTPGSLSGFRVVCSEELSDEKLAFGLITVEACDEGGQPGQLKLWDRVRANAFRQLIQSTPSFGKETAAIILNSLAKSKEIDRAAREAILQVHDSYFEESSRKLMYVFESLGKDCSLGNIQRGFGAEPMGLWRYAGINIDSVTSALNQSLAGIGTKEFTRLHVSGRGEYMSTDTRYDMLSHTFIYENEVEFERFFQQQCRKICFLAKNMIDKLTEAEKIFVVHAIPDRITDSKLAALLQAMRRFGPSQLLYLELASESNPSGTLTVRPDGIMTGFVEQIQGDDVRPTAENRRSWLSVLEKAHAGSTRKL